MRIAKLITPPAAPASILSLLGIPDEMRGSVDVVVQAPSGNSADITIGTKVSQPGFISPGGSATFEGLNLKTTFVGGDGSDTLVILVIR